MSYEKYFILWDRKMYLSNFDVRSILVRKFDVQTIKCETRCAEHDYNASVITKEMTIMKK